MIRQVAEADLQVFFEHQRDPEACAVAAFTPRELPAFLLHWRTKILGNPGVQARTIVHDAQPAGYVASWSHDATERRLAYWIGREFWRRGLASAGVLEFVQQVELTRPLSALVATSNLGSIRVLEKCGFELVPDSRSTGDDGVEEVRYLLSAPARP